MRGYKFIPTDYERKDIVRFYRDGWGQKRLAKRYGKTRVEIVEILEEEGIEIRRKLSEEEWEGRINALQDFVRQNPKKSAEKAREAGHSPALNKYGGKINQVRSEVGVPEIKAGFHNKISPEEKEHALMLSNCGIKLERIAEYKGLSKGFVNLLRMKSREEGKYAEKNPRVKFCNAVALYLETDDEKDKEMIEENVINRVADEVANQGLRSLRFAPEEKLLQDIFFVSLPRYVSKEEARELATEVIHEYIVTSSPSDSIDKSEYRENLVKESIQRTTRKLGDYRVQQFPAPFNAFKTKTAELLKLVTSGEGQLLRMRYGIDEEKPNTLREAAGHFGISRERVRQIEATSLRKIRNTLINAKYPIPCDADTFYQFLSEPLFQEIGIERYDAIRQQSYSLLRHVDSLELSVRSSKAMKDLEINYVWQLIQKSPLDFLRKKNFGRKSLKEIKSVLADMDLELGMELPETFLMD